MSRACQMFVEKTKCLRMHDYGQLVRPAASYCTVVYALCIPKELDRGQKAPPPEGPKETNPTEKAPNPTSWGMIWRSNW